MTFLALMMSPATLRLFLGGVVAGVAATRLVAAYIAYAPGSIPARAFRKAHRILHPHDGLAFPAERFMDRVLNRIHR